MANFLATSPETISRRLKALEDDTYISRKGKNIEIIDIEKFEDYVWQLKSE